MIISQGTPIASVVIHKTKRVNIPGIENNMPERIHNLSNAAAGGIRFPDFKAGYPDPLEDLLGLMTEKDISSTAGHFVLRFTTRRFQIPKLYGTQHKWVTWADLIDQHDLVLIELGRPPAKSVAGNHLTAVMVGFVNDVYFDRVVGANGEPHYQITVTGTDLAQPVYDARMYWIKALVESGETLEGFTNILLKMAKLASEAIAMTPEYLVKVVLEELLQNLVDFDVYGYNNGTPQGELFKYFEMLGWRLKSNELVQTFPFDQKFGQLHRNVENVLRDVILWPFHEFYTDLRTDEEVEIAVPEELPGSDIIEKHSEVLFGLDQAEFRFMLRPTPFPWVERSVDRSYTAPLTHHFDWWDHLKKHASIISEADRVVGKDGTLLDDAIADRLSLSRREIRSAYFIIPEYANLQGLPAMSVMPFVYNRELIALYGFQSLDIHSSVFGSKNYKGDVESLKTIRRLCWQLASWNNLNQYYLSGGKVVKLRPDLRIGTVLLEKSLIRGDKYYYIERVRHVYDFETEHSFTELSVTRGLRASTYNMTSAALAEFIGQFLVGSNNTVGQEVEKNHLPYYNPTQEVWPK